MRVVVPRSGVRVVLELGTHPGARGRKRIGTTKRRVLELRAHPRAARGKGLSVHWLRWIPLLGLEKRRLRLRRHQWLRLRRHVVLSSSLAATNHSVPWQPGPGIQLLRICLRMNMHADITE